MNNPLEEVLEGRDGRARLQAFLFSEELVVLQVSLNVPGYPKRLEGDIAGVERIGVEARKAILAGSGVVLREIGILNGAGYALLFGARLAEAPARLKRRCIDLEEGVAWGRVMDLDVLTPAGSVGRERLGFPPRLCPVCGEIAKSCARERRHGLAELREVMRRLLAESLQEPGALSSSSDWGSSSSSFR